MRVYRIHLFTYAISRFTTTSMLVIQTNKQMDLIDTQWLDPMILLFRQRNLYLCFSLDLLLQKQKEVQINFFTFTLFNHLKIILMCFCHLFTN